MDNIHRLFFYLKHDLSETGFCLHLQVEPTQVEPTQVEPTQVDQVEGVSLNLRKRK
jgi:hypothetical protein